MKKRNLEESPNAMLLQQTSLKGNQNASASVVIDLDLSLIDENPDNASIFSMSEIEKLSRTIEEEGFYGAIEVFQKSDGRYEISAGHRRTKAVELLGWKTIPAIVKTKPEEDVKVRTRLISSNINNRVMSPMDYAQAIAYHRQTLYLKHQLKEGERLRGVNITEELSQFFGLSGGYITDYLRLSKLEPKLLQFTSNPGFPWRKLIKADTLSLEQQEDLARKLAEKDSWAAFEIEKLLRSYEEEGQAPVKKEAKKPHKLSGLLSYKETDLEGLPQEELRELFVKCGELQLILKEKLHL